MRSSEISSRRYYTFQDLIGIRAARELLDQGVPLRSVHKSLRALRDSLPKVSRPLSSLRIVADGQTLVVRDDRGAYDPLTGQLVLDFEVNSLRDDVVRVLKRSGRENEHRRAYESYLEGCRLDEDEQTYDAAEAAYQRAIELDPSLANALTNLGNLMFKRDRLNEAERLYERALKIDPDQPEAHYNFGVSVVRARPGSTSDRELSARAAQRSLVRRCPFQLGDGVPGARAIRGSSAALGGLPQAGSRQPLGRDRAPSSCAAKPEPQARAQSQPIPRSPQPLRGGTGGGKERRGVDSDVPPFAAAGSGGGP